MFGGAKIIHDTVCNKIVPRKLQLLKLVDQDQIQEMTNQYSDKVKEFDQRWDEYDRRSATATTRDWQKEVEMEDSMRLVADMQMALQREIKYAHTTVCVLGVIICI